ncbi:hypothetical protein NONI108955_37880 [Nocardia ninae]|uniref:Uncharacterized protein n=1 Tax=Nocardia ninae NBRC 108245 TaxID=1210091 RepID=A0A511MJG5_9NOCA|nr:hypothetical protein [Nocardia ninae]GEM40782.1 hypothetical protein NN4_53010 [Nocardia ninae NBRC 108245]
MLVVGLVLLGAAIWGIASWLTRPNDAERCLNQLSVPGFTKVTQKADTADAGPWAEAVFVGSPVQDIKAIVTGPGLQPRLPRSAKQTTSPPPSQPAAILPVEEWVAYGDAADNCHVSIYKVLDNRGASWKLTEAQTTGMKDGTMNVFRFQVTCGDG